MFYGRVYPMRPYKKHMCHRRSIINILGAQVRFSERKKRKKCFPTVSQMCKRVVQIRNDVVYGKIKENYANPAYLEAEQKCQIFILFTRYQKTGS